MPRAYTPQQKRLRELSKQQSKLTDGTTIMTSEEVKQAQDLGFLVADKKEVEKSETSYETTSNNRGEEERHTKATNPRRDMDRSDGNRKRGGFAGTSQKLSVSKSIPGFHLHIFNDDGARIEEAISVGWEFVTPDEVGKTTPHVVSRNTDLGDKVRFLVGKQEGGGPLYAYLMKIKEEWWQEDQGLIQARNDLIDEAIRTGKDPKDGKMPEGFYVGKEGIRMTRT